MSVNTKNFPWKQGTKLYVSFINSTAVFVYEYINRDVFGIYLKNEKKVMFIPWNSILYLEFDQNGDDRKQD